MEQVARWWNGQREPSARRDIWLTTDGATWHVRARHGVPPREVSHRYPREYEARAMVDRLIQAAPGNWQDITRLVDRPSLPSRCPNGHPLGPGAANVSGWEHCDEPCGGRASGHHRIYCNACTARLLFGHNGAAWEVRDGAAYRPV